MTDRKLIVVNLVLTVACLAILAKFAQVGMEVREQAEQASANPLKAVLNLFKRK